MLEQQNLCLFIVISSLPSWNNYPTGLTPLEIPTGFICVKLKIFFQVFDIKNKIPIPFFPVFQTKFPDEFPITRG